MRLLPATTLPLAALLSFTTLLRAADLYLTPTGAGKKDGSNWENALDQSSLGVAINETMKPGDRLLLGSGTYQDATVTLNASGAAGKPKVIEGVDRGQGLPVFSSTWSIASADKGKVAIRIEPGTSHLHFKQLRIKGYMMAVSAPASKDPAAASSACTHLEFHDVDMEQMRHGFYLSHCDDVLLAGCDLKRYSKHGVRFDQGCDRVTVRQCSADCSEGDLEWETKTEALPFGFLLNDGGAPNTAFRFEDCLARNNMKANQKGRYPNGDGFVVEGNAADVSFIRCRSLRNQDGGFDLKVPDVRLEDCIAIGNKRGFRIWKTGTLTNCFAGWGPTGLWCNGGPLLATRCTFHAAEASAVMTDDRTTDPITLKDCIVSVAPDAAKARSTSGKVVLEGTIVIGPGTSVKDPAFVRPAPTWDGRGDAMNSRAYPDKGYRAAATPAAR